MSGKGDKQVDKADRKHKDKKHEKSKSKSKRTKKVSTREKKEDSEFSRTAYTALPVQSWTTSSKSTSSSKSDGAPLISSARRAGDVATSRSPATTPRAASSLDGVDSSLYAAQAQPNPVIAPANPTVSPTNLVRVPSKARTPSMMYGAFAQEEMNLGIATEPVASVSDRSKNLIPSSVSLPHLMGRKMVSQASPQTYAAMPNQLQSSSSHTYSSVPDLEQAACLESGACMPGFSSAEPESLGQKTAREYANNTAYAHYFKTDNEIEEVKAKNASNRTPRVNPSAPSSEAQPSYESVVYYSQEKEQSTPTKSKKEDDSDSDSDAPNAAGIGYSLPEDLASKQRVEGLLLRLDKRLRKLESRERRNKKVDSDDDSSDTGVEDHDLSKDDHLYSMRFQQILEDSKLSKFVSLASLGSTYISARRQFFCAHSAFFSPSLQTIL
jgi:hypothetical protein